MTYIAERSRLAGPAIVFLAAFTVYATMLPAAVGIGDEAEAQTVPYILGISHPTGFPAYTLAGWLWSHALPFGTVAWRLNAFAAVCTAAAVSGVFLLAVELARDRIVAALAAFAFAFGAMSWSGALHANAQPLAAACSVFVLFASVIFARTGDTRAFAAACACNGLALATHPNSLWALPAIAVAMLWQHRVLTPRVLLTGIAGLALPMLLYAYFPIRSAIVAAVGLDPTAGPPLFGTGSLDWDTNSPRTLSGFLDEVLARHEHINGTFAAATRANNMVPAAQLWLALAAQQYSAWLMWLAVAGVAALARVDRRALSVLAAGTLGGVTFLYAYRLDTHLDRYTFLSFAVVAALSAACLRLVAWPAASRILRVITAVVLIGVVAGSVVSNRPKPTPSGASMIDAVERDIPDGAIVVAQWNDATALAYASFVEHRLGSRIIVNGWPSDYYDQVLTWARVRPTYMLISGLAFKQLFPLPMQMSPRPSSMDGYLILAADLNLHPHVYRPRGAKR